MMILLSLESSVQSPPTIANRLLVIQIALLRLDQLDAHHAQYPAVQSQQRYESEQRDGHAAMTFSPFLPRKELASIETTCSKCVARPFYALFGFELPIWRA